MVFYLGTTYRMERNFIVEVSDSIAMNAFYKDIDVTTAPTNVSWYRHGELLLIGGRFQLSKNKTVLHIQEIQLQDKGRYRSILAAEVNLKFITEFTLVVHNSKSYSNLYM